MLKHVLGPRFDLATRAPTTLQIWLCLVFCSILVFLYSNDPAILGVSIILEAHSTYKISSKSRKRDAIPTFQHQHVAL